MSFVKSYIKFDNENNYLIFKQKIEEMVKQDFETDEDILAILDTSLQIKREREKAERERQEKEYSILLLLRLGMSAEIIAKAIHVPVEQIMMIEEKYKDNNPIDAILKN